MQPATGAKATSKHSDASDAGGGDAAPAAGSAAAGGGGGGGGGGEMSNASRLVPSDAAAAAAYVAKASAPSLPWPCAAAVGAAAADEPSATKCERDASYRSHHAVQPGGDGAAGGAGGGATRAPPQSVQSEPNAQTAHAEDGPPSSHVPGVGSELGL